MSTEERERTEGQIRELHAAENFEEAATVALKFYGGEILGFLIGVHRDEEVGSEVFAQFCEDLWRGIEAFQWRSSFRTWAYILARNSSHRFLRDPRLRRGRALRTRELSVLVDELRESTVPYLKTEVKDGVARLRESLSPEDQMLLILRVDRTMSWRDVARVMVGEDQADDAKAVKREAARIRKRFERVKQQLRKLAMEEGLLGDSEAGS